MVTTQGPRPAPDPSGISNEGRVVRELEEQLKNRADRALGDDTE